MIAFVNYAYSYNLYESLPFKNGLPYILTVHSIIFNFPKEKCTPN